MQNESEELCNCSASIALTPSSPLLQAWAEQLVALQMIEYLSKDATLCTYQRTRISLILVRMDLTAESTLAAAVVAFLCFLQTSAACKCSQCEHSIS